VYFSFFTFFNVSHDIPCLRVFFSHFHNFQFCCHIPGPKEFFSHFPRLSLFSPYSIFLQCLSHFPRFLFSRHIQILQCTYLIFHVFHCFLSCSRSYQCEFHCFLVGHFSHNIQSPRVFSSHFPRFSVFSPYSRSNSVCVSFSTLFRFFAISIS